MRWPSVNSFIRVVARRWGLPRRRCGGWPMLRRQRCAAARSLPSSPHYRPGRRRTFRRAPPIARRAGGKGCIRKPSARRSRWPASSTMRSAGKETSLARCIKTAGATSSSTMPSRDRSPLRASSFRHRSRSAETSSAAIRMDGTATNSTISSPSRFRSRCSNTPQRSSRVASSRRASPKDGRLVFSSTTSLPSQFRLRCNSTRRFSRADLFSSRRQTAGATISSTPRLRRSFRRHRSNSPRPSAGAFRRPPECARGLLPCYPAGAWL